MTQRTLKQNRPDEQTDVYEWSARYWPAAQGNPFLPLADPEYNGRMLKERAMTLKRLALPRAHTAADPLEASDADTDTDPLA